MGNNKTLVLGEGNPTMIVAFAFKKGRTLMGEVIEESENVYIVKVTSWERKVDKNLVGTKMMVRKENAQICK